MNKILKTAELNLPEIALVAGTRAMLGAGIGLLMANRLEPKQRQAAGWALTLFGALSTIPLALQVMGRRAEPSGPALALHSSGNH